MKQQKEQTFENQPEKKLIRNNCKNDFDEYEQCYLQCEYGQVCTWGSGEMGQLGHPQGLINTLLKDKEGFPFQPYPLCVNQIKNIKITDVSAGEGIQLLNFVGYSVAVDIYGKVYSWGASACGQLGISSIQELPTDIEGFPYQPIPTLIDSLSGIRILQIATGDAHCVARSIDGKLYSWGGGGCGQLGHPDTHLMPKDEDGCAYLPKPVMIESLKDLIVKEVRKTF